MTATTTPSRPKHHFLNPEKPPTAPIILIPPQAFVTAEIPDVGDSFQLHFYMPGGECIRYIERTNNGNIDHDVDLYPTRFTITCAPYKYGRENAEPYSWQNHDYGRMHSSTYIKGMTKAYAYDPHFKLLRTTKADLPTLNAYSTFKLCLGNANISGAKTFAAFYDMWRLGSFNGDTLSKDSYEALDPFVGMEKNTRETVLTPAPRFCDGLLTIHRKIHRSAWDILKASGVMATTADFLFLPVKRIVFRGVETYATPVLPTVQRSWLIHTRINGTDNVPIHFLATQITREQLASHL
jgi:hypothetical protein